MLAKLDSWKGKLLPARNPSPDKLPHTLERNRIYILPTRFGLVFSGIIFAMLLLSVKNTNNLGFILTFLLSGILVVSILHTYKNLERIVFHSIEARPVFAGEQAVFECLLSAEGIRPLVEIGFRGTPRLVTKIGTGSRSKVEIRYPAEKRGKCFPGRITLATPYPFSLFRAWSHVHHECYALVYPKPLYGDIASRYLSDEQTEAGEENGELGTDDFTGLRTYQSGDSPRQIHWKAVSRGQGVFTKVFSKDQGKVLLFDFKELGQLETETKLSTLSFKVIDAAKHQFTYALALPQITIDAGADDAHKHKCLKALALFGAER